MTTFAPQTETTNNSLKSLAPVSVLKQLIPSAIEGDFAGMNSEEVMSVAGLDYNLTLQDLEVCGTKVPDRKAVWREDTKSILGIHSESYGLVQNEKLFEACDAITGGEVDYCGAFEVDGGKKVGVMMQCPSVDIEGDEHGRYLTALTSRDGSMSFSINVLLVRFACTNGMVLGNLDASLKTKHTRFANARIDAQIDVMRMVSDVTDNYAETINMVKGKMFQSYQDRLAFYKKLFNRERVADEGRGATMFANKVAELETHWGHTTTPQTGNGWQMMNTITHWADHGQHIVRGRSAESAKLERTLLNPKVQQNALKLLAA